MIVQKLYRYSFYLFPDISFNAIGTSLDTSDPGFLATKFCAISIMSSLRYPNDSSAINKSGRAEPAGVSAVGAKSVADVVMYMSDGVIEEMGPPEQIFNNPQSIKTKTFLQNALEAF